MLSGRVPTFCLCLLGLPLSPVPGIACAAVWVGTARLLHIVATVHGLSLRCGFEVRSQTLIVFKTDRLRTYDAAMSEI